MIAIIGPWFALHPFSVLTLLVPGFPRWLVGQHARLLPPRPKRHGQVALAEPRAGAGS